MARQRRTITLVIGLIAACAATVACASQGVAKRSSPQAGVAAAAARGPVVGLIAGDSEWSNPTIGLRLNQVISRTRTKSLREGFFWSRIEPSPGIFRFAHYDHYMLLAARRHEHVMALLYEPPQWADPSPNTLPSDPSAYAAYVAAVVRRYGPHGTLWARHPRLRGYAISTYDLWNEPYYDSSYDPARYADLVKAAGRAGHAVDPSAKFLLGAEMQGQLIGSQYVWWVDALYQAVPDLNNYFDGVSVHPYGHDITGLAQAIPGHAYDGYSQMRRIEVIRKQFVKRGAAGKPFWITEVGWPTCTQGSSRCVSDAGQVASLRALMHYSRTIWKDYVRAVFIYYYDDVGSSSADPEANYGLTNVHHAGKPALGVFRAFARSAPVTEWP